MSRIGKKEIAIPAGVQVTHAGMTVSVKGPKGELKREFLPDIAITITPTTITLAPKATNVFMRSLWGTYGSHLQNMIDGVTKGYEKKLLIEGTGYKWEVTPASGEAKGAKMKLALGFSHPVLVDVPAGLTVRAEKGELTITGIDKEVVGSWSAYIRSLKKPEPYKGKGIRYSTEVIERKQGKRSAA